MASTLTRGFMFRPRLTEFEGRLTPSTALDNHTYTPPPQNTSPATTDNDNMGTAPPGGTTNDGMGSANPHDTTNDDMGSGDGTAGDPGNGVSGTPPRNTNQPTGNPPPAGSTVIGGPGRLPYPPGSLTVVIQDSAGGDAVAIGRQLSGDSRVVDGVTSWDELSRELAKAPAGSLGSLIISGHGYVLGGVCGTAPGGEITYTTAISDLMNDPATLAMIKSRLAPGAPIIIASYSCANIPSALQKLANATGHPVIANTGSTSSGDNGTGNWVRYDPKPQP